MVTDIIARGLAVQNKKAIQELQNTGVDTVARESIEKIHPQNTIYVSKKGNDDNDGTIDKQKLTITSALTVAQSLITGGATRAVVVIQDAGSYEESITIPDNVELIGESATIIGKITIKNNCKVNIYAHYASEGTQQMLVKEGTSHAYYKTVISDGRGLAGNLTWCTNIYNSTQSSILFTDVELMFVGTNGSGIREVSSTTGHIHFNIKDMYLNSNGRGIYAQGVASNIIGKIDHIIKSSGATGTTAISITTANSVVKITVDEIVADTVYNIEDGILYLNCPKISGATIGIPAFLPVSQQELNQLTNNGAIIARVVLTQAEYDALVVAEEIVETTEYIIVEDDG